MKGLRPSLGPSSGGRLSIGRQNLDDLREAPTLTAINNKNFCRDRNSTLFLDLRFLGTDPSGLIKCEARNVEIEIYFVQVYKNDGAAKNP
jgi:hypothetical protein